MINSKVATIVLLIMMAFSQGLVASSCEYTVNIDANLPQTKQFSLKYTIKFDDFSQPLNYSTEPKSNTIKLKHCNTRDEEIALVTHTDDQEVEYFKSKLFLGEREVNLGHAYTLATSLCAPKCNAKHVNKLAKQIKTSQLDEKLHALLDANPNFLHYTQVQAFYKQVGNAAKTVNINLIESEFISPPPMKALPTKHARLNQLLTDWINVIKQSEKHTQIQKFNGLEKQVMPEHMVANWFRQMYVNGSDVSIHINLYTHDFKQQVLKKYQQRDASVERYLEAAIKKYAKKMRYTKIWKYSDADKAAYNQIIDEVKGKLEISVDTIKLNDPDSDIKMVWQYEQGNWRLNNFL